MTPSPSLTTNPPHLLALRMLMRMRDPARPLTEHDVSLLVDTIEMAGWDPDATDPRYTAWQETFFDLLLDTENPKQEILDARFPLDLEAFKEQAVITAGFARNHEWLMAFAVASGHNPWEERESTRWAPERKAFQLVTTGRWAVLEQMLLLPGAPSVQALLDMPPPEHWDGSVKTLGELMVNHPTGHQGLARLLAFAKHPPTIQDGMWGLARPKAFVAMTAGGCAFPTDPTARKAVRNQWDRRVQSQEMSADRYTKLLALEATATGATPPPESEAKSMALLQSLLGHGWGKPLPQDPLGAWHDPIHKGLSAEILTAPIEIQGSPLDGTWTLLAGYWAQRIKAMKGNALHREHPSDGIQFEHWSLASGEQGRGQLQGALDVEWCDGISLNGVIALGLLSQIRAKQHYFDNADQRIHDGNVDLVALEPAAQRLGIKDFEAFCRGNVASAVAFTEIALQKTNKLGAKAMAKAWSNVFVRIPDLLEGQPALAARLMKALIRDGNRLKLNILPNGSRTPHSSGDTTMSLGLVMLALGREFGVHSYGRLMQPPVWADLNPDQRRLMTEFTIALESPEWVASIQEAAAQGIIEKEIIERLKVWHDNLQVKKDAENSMTEAGWATIRHMALDQALEPVTTPRPKQRF